LVGFPGLGSPGLILTLIVLQRQRATSNTYNPNFTHHNPTVAVVEVDVGKGTVDVLRTVLMVPVVIRATECEGGFGVALRDGNC
jgi:hypothetical protein